MKPVTVTTESREATMKLGQRLAAQLKPGSIVCLFGELGSGKTTFVKGMARGLRISPVKVHSPTFVLMNIYEGKLSLYHFDFYRLEDVREIEKIGYEEFLFGEGVAVVEWPQRMGSLLPEEYVKIELKIHGENSRTIKITACGKKYQSILERLK